MKTIKKILQEWTSTSLVLRIVIGLVIGVALGLAAPEWTAVGLLGQVFLNALKGIAPVLVFVLVASSIARAHGGLGSRFRSLISCYLLNTFLAAVLAVVGSFLFPVTLQLGVEAQGEPAGALTDVFYNLFTNLVTNPLLALSNGNYIGILFWAIVIGLALKLKASEVTINVVHDFAEVISQVVKWVIQFAPFGILGLVFSSVSVSGMETFTAYGHLVLLLAGCMLFNALVTNPLISFFMMRRNPYPLLFTCLKESVLNAFFTRSSAQISPSI